MGYEVDLYFYDRRMEESLGGTKNYIPFFWAYLFYINDYDVTCAEAIYMPELLLDLDGKFTIESDFEGDLLLCWNEFIELLLFKKQDSSCLSLNLNDYLLAGYDWDKLQTIEEVSSAVTAQLEYTIEAFDCTKISETGLIGYMDLSDFQCNTIIKLSNEKNIYKDEIMLKNNKQTSFIAPKIKAVLLIVIMMLIAIIFVPFSVREIIVSSKLLGFSNLFLFGFGTPLVVKEQIEIIKAQ
ncbi:hypothetical protein ACYSNW_03490 [Enterococcus sp. LJL99]